MARQLVRSGGGLVEVLRLPDGRDLVSTRDEPFDVPDDVADAFLKNLIEDGTNRFKRPTTRARKEVAE